MRELVKHQFVEAQKVLENFISDENNWDKITQAIHAFSTCIQNGGKVLSCGNGGSMSDAMHFAEELTGRFRDNRKALPALAISDPSHITCVANDFGFDHVFSRFIEGIGKKEDALLAISTSGNSPNIIHAVTAAKSKGMFILALTGKDGGKLAQLADLEIRVPHGGYSDRIQEIHIKIIHTLIAGIEKNLC